MSKSTTGRQMLEALEKRVAALETYFRIMSKDISEIRATQDPDGVRKQKSA